MKVLCYDAGAVFGVWCRHGFWWLKIVSSVIVMAGCCIYVSPIF